jgi:membrane dipeptidase
MDGRSSTRNKRQLFAIPSPETTMQGHTLAWLISVAIACSSLAQAAPRAAGNDAVLAARIAKVLADTPLIDGHNDLPWELRARGDVDLRVDHSKQGKALAGQTPLMTDIPRMRAGGMGGQFWSVWIPPSTTGPAAVQMTLEEIDIVRTMVARYPDAFEVASRPTPCVRQSLPAPHR